MVRRFPVAFHHSATMANCIGEAAERLPLPIACKHARQTANEGWLPANKKRVGEHTISVPAYTVLNQSKSRERVEKNPDPACVGTDRRSDADSVRATVRKLVKHF